MGNARFISNKIWRTVVVAGAMLGAPACGGGQKPAPVEPASDQNPTGQDVAADPKADEQKLADEKAAADAKAAEDARLLAEQEAADKAAADKAAADAKAAEEAKAAAEAAKKRPRGGGQKPVGRGFVLA